MREKEIFLLRRKYMKESNENTKSMYAIFEEMILFSIEGGTSRYSIRAVSALFLSVSHVSLYTRIQKPQ